MTSSTWALIPSPFDKLPRGLARRTKPVIFVATFHACSTISTNGITRSIKVCSKQTSIVLTTLLLSIGLGEASKWQLKPSQIPRDFVWRLNWGRKSHKRSGSTSRYGDYNQSIGWTVYCSNKPPSLNFGVGTEKRFQVGSIVANRPLRLQCNRLVSSNTDTEVFCHWHTRTETWDECHWME